MCGIFLCISQQEILDEVLLKTLCPCLKNRGPDSCNTYRTKLTLADGTSLTLSFHGFVLWLRGSHVTTQPIVDSLGNVLLWNGDAFEADFLLEGNKFSDTDLLSERLSDTPDELIIPEISKIRGPFAFAYYRPESQKLWFGRDFFGRHSLLVKFEKKNFVLSSVGHQTLPGFFELPASGLCELDLGEFSDPCQTGLHIAPWRDRTVSQFFDGYSFLKPVDGIVDKLIEDLSDDHSVSFSNGTTDNGDNGQLITSFLSDPEFQKIVTEFSDVLTKSVSTRVEAMPKLCKNCILETSSSCPHSKLGILFSGGLDSSVLACLADRCLDESEPLDLLNVAFQQSDGSFEVPDRQTAFKAIQELRRINPRRKFNLVLINVTKNELIEKRGSVICHLLHPLNTVLDDSIGCAVWFAARGHGFIPDSKDIVSEEVYKSPVRVLLLGAGADEQLGGYSRHRARFSQSGWTGLLDEIRLELDRISERNLGRDNRIVCDHGVEGRYPFLDENVVSFLNQLPLQRKCDLRLGRGVGEKLLLRALAFKLGLRHVAFEPKRAIQFGSRIARMENRKEKATDLADRLNNIL